MASVRRLRSLLIHWPSGVVLDEGVGELHRVVADDVADRGAVGGGPLDQVREVLEHLHEDVALDDRPGST